MNKIGIIGAMDVEIAIFREEMQKNGSLKESAAGSLVFYEGILSEKNVVVVKSSIEALPSACMPTMAMYSAEMLECRPVRQW